MAVRDVFIFCLKYTCERVIVAQVVLETSRKPSISFKTTDGIVLSSVVGLAGIYCIYSTYLGTFNYFGNALSSSDLLTSPCSSIKRQ